MCKFRYFHFEKIEKITQFENSNFLKRFVLKTINLSHSTQI